VPDRLLYDIILVGGNEMRVRFDDYPEANRFFDEVCYDKTRLPFVQVTRISGDTWYVRPGSVVAWRPA
jgi:hypothetical protein